MKESGAKSQYIIYGIYQDGAKLVYIGSTRVALKLRFKKHCYIKTGAMYPVIQSIGKEHFDIRKLCDGFSTATETFRLEGKMIKEYQDRGCCLYNKSYGCVPNDETRKKLSRAGMGRKLTEEAKAKISKTHKGNKYWLGKHHSEETKLLKSIILKNYPKFSKKVLCVEKNIIYPSIREAMRETGLDRSHISKCCIGKQQTTGGYHWQFAE